MKLCDYPNIRRKDYFEELFSLGLLMFFEGLMEWNWGAYFTDAVLRGPILGSMLMSLSASLVGVIVFLRKQSLIGESLSHATYPGVNLGALLAAVFLSTEQLETNLAFFIMGGAFLSSLLGFWMIIFLEKKLRIKSDSALCFVLSAFFGVGLTIVSQIQFTYASLYRQIQSYLYGQVATMTDLHIWIYAALSLVILSLIILFYKEIQIITFDGNYASALGVNVQTIEKMILILAVLAVVIGIRSVGVVLISSMLIAPAAAARQYTNKLYKMFFLAALFGGASGFMGNVLSLELSKTFMAKYPQQRIFFPTGPMIVIVASMICLFSLLFAPERGFCFRLWRRTYFRYRCICENLLKALWRLGPNKNLTFKQISRYQTLPPWYLSFILRCLISNGWVYKIKHRQYSLTPNGVLWAAKIDYLHQLWEAYLVDYLGVGGERVHRSAEEMEHIITPDLEKKLTFLLEKRKRECEWR